MSNKYSKYQLKLSRPLISTAQMWVSFALSLLIFVFSLTPMITLDVMDTETREGINKILTEIDGGEDYLLTEEDEKFGVSAPSLVTSINVFSKLLSDEKSSDAKFDTITSESGIKTIKMCAAVVLTLKDSLSAFDSNETGIVDIIWAIVMILVFGYMLLFILILPIVAAILLIKNILAVANHLKHPEMVSADMASRVSGMLSWPLLFLVFGAVFPNINFGVGSVGIIYACIAIFALSVVISRTREYTDSQFVYLNIIQGASIAAIVGFLIYFFNILKTGFISSFFKGFSSYSITMALLKKDIGGMAIFDLILVLLYASACFSIVAYLIKALQRFSCTMEKKESGNSKDMLIVEAVIYLLFTIVVPKYILSTEHAVIGSYKGHLAELTESGASAQSVALAGAIILLAAEIAIIVLKIIFCQDLPEEEADDVLTGLSKTPAEKLAAAKKLVAASEAAEPAAVPASAEPKTPAVAPAQPATPQESIADQLKKYKDLLDAGAITQEEYDKIKDQLLNS